MTAAGPLAGVRVLELTQIIAGPFAGMLLADMGAEVIKVEPPGGETMRHVAPWAPGESRAFLTHNRGKRSIVLDLASEAGRAAFYRLVPLVDVVLTNYRPGVPEALGIGYDDLRPLHPGLIYAEGTAFGREGPLALRGGVDFIAQALSGLLAGEGKLDSSGLPQPMTPPPADYGTGMLLVAGICAALYHRERTGEGQRVDATLLGTALAMQTVRFSRVEAQDGATFDALAEELAGARVEQRDFRGQLAVYHRHRPPAAGNVYYRSYQTSDGYLAVGAFGVAMWARFRAATGLEDPRVRPDGSVEFAAAGKEEALRAMVTKAEALFRTRTTADWSALLEAHGVPAGPIHFAEELFEHPQVLANGLVAELEHELFGPLRMAGPPLRMSATPLAARGASPLLGADTAALLAEAGYSAEEIDALRAGDAG